MGYIYILPTDIEKQKYEKLDIQFWTKEEIDFFLKSINGTYLYTPILVDVLTGLRITELCGLRWKYIDLENGFLEVNRKGTMCTPRNLSMEFTKKIKHYKEPLDELQEKFPEKDFSNYMQLKQITFHGLRHTHVSLSKGYFWDSLSDCLR